MSSYRYAVPMSSRSLKREPIVKLGSWIGRRPSVLIYPAALYAMARYDVPAAARPYGLALVAIVHVAYHFRSKFHRPRRLRDVGGPPGLTGLYRWYGEPDCIGRPLYIGISYDPVNRYAGAGGHVDKGKPWTRQVRSCSVDWYSTRLEALDAEEHAIKTERPVANIVHNLTR